MKAIHYAQDASRLRKYMTLLDAALKNKAECMNDLQDPRARAELVCCGDVELVRASLAEQIDRLELEAKPQQAVEQVA